MSLQNEIMETVVNADRKKRLMFAGRRLLGCAALLSMPVSAGANEAAPRTVWAKADIGYEQYRNDGLECGMKGLASNIDNSAEVKTLARASRQLESIDASARAAWSQDAGQMGQTGLGSVQMRNGLDIAANKAIQAQAVREAARPEEQYARIKEMMFQIVRSCMIDRGYAKIVLTEDQRKEYGRVEGGADARRAYIHKLASDPHVLEAQREVAAQ